MGTKNEQKGVDILMVEQWLQIRKEEAKKIDPETAEINWLYGQIMDPYGVDPDLPPECDQVGRLYFVRSPEGDVWVSFCDLPEEICKKLCAMVESEFIYP